jgi:hypothetical protein
MIKITAIVVAVIRSMDLSPLWCKSAAIAATPVT